MRNQLVISLIGFVIVAGLTFGVTRYIDNQSVSKAAMEHPQSQTNAKNTPVTATPDTMSHDTATPDVMTHATATPDAMQK